MTFIKKTKKTIFYIFKILFISIIIGILGGLLGTAFHTSLDYVTHLREQNPYILYFLPLGGIVIVFIYNLSANKGNIDTKRVLDSVRENRDIPVVMIPLIFAGTLITHLFGASAGREGAALQLGGSMGYNLAGRLRQDDKTASVMVTAGMSSVFAALFGVPLAATVFSLELTKKKGGFSYSGILPGLVSSVTAFAVSGMFRVLPVRFTVPRVTEYNISMILKVSVLALLCAVICIIFAESLHRTEFVMKKYIQNSYIRAVVGGLAIVVLTVCLGTTDYNGAGMEVIERAISGDAKSIAFLMKIVFTVITAAAGFKGGEIVPTFFIGATFGCLTGGFMGFDAGLCAALGFVAMFSGMTKCPIASLLLAAEVFGVNNLPLFALVIIIAGVFSGPFGLYENKEKTLFKVKYKSNPKEKQL